MIHLEAKAKGIAQLTISLSAAKHTEFWLVGRPVQSTYMLQDSGFRYKVSINKGFTVFHRSNADRTLDVGYDTAVEKKKKTL